jgi:hypothetical protein
MKTEFKLNRQKITQAELEKHQNFDDLVRQLKNQKMKKDKGNERCKILKIEVVS